MLLMRANPIRGQMGGGWALEIDTFLDSVKWPVHCTLVQGIRVSRLQLPAKDLTGLHGDGQERVKKKRTFLQKNS
jgi:hypothetical protein